MTTPIEIVEHKIDALDRRLAGEHTENRDVLKGQDAKLVKIDEKLDKVIEQVTRHDEQIRQTRTLGAWAGTILAGTVGLALKKVFGL